MVIMEHETQAILLHLLFIIYGLAVDPADPNTIVVSASQSAWQAHYIERANSLVYRRSIENDGGAEWKAVSNGLPQSEGTIIAILAANPRNKGEFYAINNRGLFCSTDTGLSWRELDVSWSKEYLSQHSWPLAVKGQD